MLKFSDWLTEARKKKTVVKEPKYQTTVVSAPIRGPNQDQSGFNTTSSTANYTVSD
jgi:hypothetical protein